MTDAMLIDMLLHFVLPVGGLFAAIVVLRRVALWLLYRVAPVWLVGPHGLLIDTKTNMGTLQLRDNLHSHGGDGGAGNC
jgi:hypothetical protein